MEVVSNVVGKVVDLLFAEVGRQIAYLIRYKDNVAGLKQKVEDLNLARERMQGRIDEAEMKGEVVETDIRAWSTSVDNIISDAETFLATEDVAATKGACFKFGSRYQSSWKASKKTSLVLEFLEKCDKFVTVSHAPPPPGIDAHSRKNIDAYESQKSSLKKMMDALDDERIQIVGVCGIGGVGKTTLVTELGKRVKANKQFHDVVMVVVSQQINIMKTQDDLAGLLGMNQLPGDESRKGKLWDRLCKGNKVLVILDDLWSKLDLDELGVPVGVNDHPNIKIVLTSRSKDVCNEMDAQEVISVEPMPEGEAWSLFKQVVGEAVETDPEINTIAEDVARECKGLPIAILAVGRALRNKRKVEWEDAYHQLQKAAPPSVNPMLREVFPKLELSYRYLESEEAKLCFLLCCMFPEDYDIPVESLAQYGMGIKLFQQSGTTLQDARRGARNAVSTLKHSYLLLNGDNDDHVKMHDVVRDVAIAITSKDNENEMFLVKASVGLTAWPELDSFKKYTGISLMDNVISEVSLGLECPKLQILLLQDNHSLKTIPNEFFQGMQQLKVLDLKYCFMSSIPSSLSMLTSLRSLDLSYSEVQDISSLESLTQLQVLNLASTPIVGIPEQIGRLINLRLLDVRSCFNLSGIAAGVISNLRKLEDFYIGDSFTKWDIEGEANKTKNASLVELDSLHLLTNLDIVMPDVKLLPQNLQFKSLKRFNITIGSDKQPPIGWDTYPQYCILRLTLDIHMPLLDWIKKLMKAAYCLSFRSCINLNGFISGIKEVNFNNIRFLEVSMCDEVSCLAKMAELSSMPVFCNLEELHLNDLENFTEICEAQLLPKSGSFSKLSKLIIQECHKMSIELGVNILSSLPNLRDLQVFECSSLEYIIGSWPKSCIGSTSCLQNLRYILLTECTNLKYVFAPNIAQLLRNLEFLHVWKCKKVESIIGREINGDITEAIVGTEKITMFPSLKYIHLFDLPSLKIFCSENYKVVEYPCLSQVTLHDCQTIEAWGYGVQVTPSLKKNNLDDKGSDIMALREGAYGTELIISHDECHPSSPGVNSEIMRAAALFTIAGITKERRKKKKHPFEYFASSSV